MKENLINIDLEAQEMPQMQLIGTIATVGGVIAGAKYISDKINGIIDKVDETARGLLRQIKGDIEEIINTLEEKFQDNMNMTLDQVDMLTSKKLRELEDLFAEINAGIQDDIELITKNLQESVQLTVGEIEDALNKTIYRFGEGAVYVVDRATNNIITIVSLIAFAVGLIAFPVVLLKTGLPDGLARTLVLGFMGFFVLLFGAALLIPGFRLWLMSYTGLGLKARIDTKDLDLSPRVIKLDPDFIMMGETKDLKIWGLNLWDEEKEQTLVARLAEKEIPIKIKTRDTIILDLSQFEFEGKADSYTVDLMYNGKTEISEIMEIRRPIPPGNLRVTSIKFNPASPEKGKSVRVEITVQNIGEGPIDEPTIVAWKPDTSKHGEISLDIPPLDSGKSHAAYVYDHVYRFDGKITTQAIADKNTKVEESNEGDNDFTKTITVKVPPPPVQHGIKVYNGHGRSGKSAVFEQHEYNLGTARSPRDGFNDKIQSLEIVGSNKRAIVYEHKDFGGRGRYVSGFVDKDKLSNEEFFKKISSIKIVNRSSVKGVTIYKDSRFKGKSAFLDGSFYSYKDLIKLKFVYQNTMGSFPIPPYKSHISSLRTFGGQWIEVGYYSGTKFKKKKIQSYYQLKDIDLNDKIIEIRLL